jgi:hypothetical protein
VNLLNTIFIIGVILAIFGFIWGLIRIGLILLFPQFNKEVTSQYFLRGVQYLFLIQTTFIFLTEDESRLSLEASSLVITGLLLIFFFLSKLQRRQQQQMMFQFIQNGQNFMQNAFNPKAERILILFGCAVFTALVFYPELAYSPITRWLHESIIGIEDTPIIGFIFRVIGFFFLMSVIGKTIQSIRQIISGKQKGPALEEPTKGEDEFDDYEEIK